MIYNALTQLERYLKFRFRQYGYTDWQLELAPLPKDGRIEGKELVITLVRIEEETSNKRQVAYRKGPTPDSLYMVNPDICLNLYILISSYASNYGRALRQISEVMRLLNSDKEPVMRTDSTSNESDVISQTDVNAAEYMKNLNVEMLTLTSEQHNSLWQTLGCSVAPSVMYKLRMLVLTAPDTLDETKLVGIDYKADKAVVPDPVKIGVKQASTQEIVSVTDVNDNL